MSKTTDVLVKWQECGPMELTEAEKQFCKLVKIKATPMLGKDLQPGDLFSMAPPSYWNQIDTNGSIGEKVHIRTNVSPYTTNDWGSTIYKIEIERI